MDKLKAVTGRWRGTYSYDPSEHMPNQEPVPFTLALSQGWFGRFTGTVTDHGPRGMPGTGAITGRFSYPRIEFTKQMPICYVGTSDGRSISLRESLIEQGHTCDRDVPHTPIFYRGEFTDPTRARGTWIIRAGVVSLPGGISVQMAEGTGVWTIEL